MLIKRICCIVIVLLVVATLNAEETQRKQRRNRKNKRRKLKEFRVKGTTFTVSPSLSNTFIMQSKKVQLQSGKRNALLYDICKYFYYICMSFLVFKIGPCRWKGWTRITWITWNRWKSGTKLILCELSSCKFIFLDKK
jgi:Flp pilus assembly protein TadB